MSILSSLNALWMKVSEVQGALEIESAQQGHSSTEGHGFQPHVVLGEPWWGELMSLLMSEQL